MKSMWLLLWLVPVSVAACGLEDAQQVELQGGARLYYQTEPVDIEVLQHFRMRFLFCDAGQHLPVSNLRVDALMPAHGHGMNYRARLSQNADGSMEASDLLFHMRGLWQVNMDYRSGGVSRQVVLEYQL